jgi:valyl-tRNA synthetase
MGLARLEKLQIQRSAHKPDGAIGFVESGVEVFVNLLGEIDVKKERGRLEQEIDQTRKYIDSLESKLSNDNFVKNAPMEVVEKEKQKLAEAKEKMEKINKQWNNFK